MLLLTELRPIVADFRLAENYFPVTERSRSAVNQNNKKGNTSLSAPLFQNKTKKQFYSLQITV